jgi:acyl dehydratase
MALKTNILGMSHEYSDSFEVGREKVREYATSVKADDPASHDDAAAAELGYAGLVAPPTFMSVLALLVQKEFFRVVDVGMDTMQIVQVDQKFVYHKPIVAGDRVWSRFDVQSVTERFGADIVVTKNTLTNADGEIVMEAYTTLMGQEGGESSKIKFDAATGNITRA